MSDSAHSVRPHPTPFIVLEGVDGSGKSTQVELLAAWLREQGATVCVTREPGSTVLAERLRALILDPSIRCAPRAELLMLLAARAQHVTEVIAPALDAGEIVVSDRFSLSSFAYQGYGRGLPLQDICTTDAVATGGIIPAMTVFIDVPLDAGIARTIARGRGIGERQDRFEGEGRQFLQRVIEGYRQLAAADPCVHSVDGSGSVEEVQQAILRAVRPLVDPILAGGQNL